ncbi:MAG: T9SS type A sorting domain-containing protein [Bacteroidia bacterium]
MKLFAPIITLLLIVNIAFCQDVQYNLITPTAVTPSAFSTLKGEVSDYAQHIDRIAPLPGSEVAASEEDRIRKILKERYPIRPYQAPARRSTTDKPTLGKSFEGPNRNRGIPLDTDLAISDAGQAVAMINFQIEVFDAAIGASLGQRSLIEFFDIDSTIGTVFDPKVIYDPGEDRFIAVALAFSEVESHIYLAFSKTSDATGEWNIYTLDGNPKDNNTWFDFPLMSVSLDELFITGNSFPTGNGGFRGSYIYQIDKQKGYAGDSLTHHVWTDLEVEGEDLGFICPVKGATGNYGPDFYFLSNTPFGVDQEGFVLFQIFGTIGSRLPSVYGQKVKTDMIYNRAPNAVQMDSSSNLLRTMDLRVLDAFFHQDKIQLAISAINPATGLSSIYHAVMDSIYDFPKVSAQLLADSASYSYASIVYTGQDDLDESQEAIIFCDYSLHGDAGTGAFFIGADGVPSDFLICKEGESIIDVINGSGSERWGDYTGAQRKYNNPGEVWAIGTYGTMNSARSYISQLYKPGVVSSVEPALASDNVNIYPNPASARVYVDFSVEYGQKVEILLLDAQGREIKRFYSFPSGRSGEHRFSFDASILVQGVYMLSIQIDRNAVATKRLVIE